MFMTEIPFLGLAGPDCITYVHYATLILGIIFVHLQAYQHFCIDRSYHRL